MTTTPEPDQVAEVLARVAGEHRHQWAIFKDWPQSGCTCGARDRAVVDVNSSEISAAEHRAHLATAQAAALRAAGLVVEGTEVEEWGVQYGDGEIDHWTVTRDGVTSPGDRSLAEETIKSARRDIAQGHADADDYEPMTLVRRTQTTYPDRVTEWVAVDEGGE